MDVTVEARAQVGATRLGLGFVCDVADARGWAARAEALRWCLERGVTEYAGQILNGAIIGAPAMPEDFE